MRLACRWWFLDRLRREPGNPHWGEAALSIGPPAWRAATASCIARLPAAQALRSEIPANSSPREVLAHWPKGDAGGNESPAFATISDDSLVDLIGDLAPARLIGDEAGTIGDHALRLLGNRWGLDPALCAGTAMSGPWGDAERVTLARAVKAWWTSTAGQPFATRIARAVPAMILADLPQALARRAVHHQIRVWMEQSRANSGLTATGASAQADDQPAMITALGAELAARLPEPPPSMSSETVQGLMATFHAEPTFRAVVDAWPRAGRLAAVMAAWDDAHGTWGGVDARGIDWLLNPQTDEPLLNSMERLSGFEVGAGAYIRSAWTTPMAWWVSNGTPGRWHQLSTLIASDLTSLRTARLLAGCGRPCQTPTLTDQPASNLSIPLIWTALADQRQLTADLTALALHMDQRRLRSLSSLPYGEAPPAAVVHGPPAGILRVCDLVLIQALLFGVDGWTAVMEDRSLTAVCLASPVADRDRVISALRSAYQKQAEATIAGLSDQRPADRHARSTPAVQKAAPGLTAEESVACRRILAQAHALGFPDLSGSHVMTQGLEITGGGSWWGIHLQLRDGSWLAQGIYPVAADQVKQHGEAHIPSGTEALRGITTMIHRLPPADQARFKDNAIIAPFLDDAEGGVLGALSWWESGSDSTGGSVVAACLQAASDGRFTSDSFARTSGRGQHHMTGTVPSPAIPGVLQQAIARWFCNALVLAQTAADADRCAQAARAMLNDQDRPLWEDMIGRLRQRFDIPKAAAPGGDLAGRLASWRDIERDPATGTWVWPGPPPASIDDTPALVDLLGDPRPTRWLAAAWVPLTVGDAALAALSELWHVDWRWCVVDEPRVAACLPVPDKAVVGRGGEGRFLQSLWTDQVRNTVATAIKAWWARVATEHLAPIHAFVLHAPMDAWDEVLMGLPPEFFDDALADIIAVHWAHDLHAQDLETQTDGRMRIVMAMALRYPHHAGITATLESWPASPWLSRLNAMRSGLAGSSATLDLAFHDLFAGAATALPNKRTAAGAMPDYLTSPWVNLGLMTQTSTPERLATWRAALSRDLTEPTTLGLLALVGRRTYPIIDLVWGMDQLLFPHNGDRGAVLPAQVTLNGLADRRPIPEASIPILVESIQRRDYNQMPPLATCPGVRVCDAVAYQLLRHANEFPGEWQPHDVRDPVDLLAAAPELRDADIAKIIAAFTGLVHHLNAPPPVLGVTDF